MVVIYSLNDPRTGEPRYVGMTHGIKQRYKHHLRDRCNTEKGCWLQELSRHNLRPEMIILQKLHSNQSWQRAEIKWIKRLRANGYALTNSSDGGTGGVNPSEATRRKISLANKGRRRTSEQRRHMSKAHTGKRLSEEHRRHIGDGNRGNKRGPHTEETKRKISKSKQGQRHLQTEEAKKKIGDANRGLKRTAEQKKRLSLAHKGYKFSEARKRAHSIVIKKMWRLRKRLQKQSA